MDNSDIYDLYDDSYLYDYSEGIGLSDEEMYLTTFDADYDYTSQDYRHDYYRRF